MTRKFSSSIFRVFLACFAGPPSSFLPQNLVVLAKRCRCEGRDALPLDPAMTADPVNHVRLKPYSTRHVPHQNALVLFQFDQLGKIRGNAETAFVIHVRGGHDSSMNLRFEERYLHASQTTVYREALKYSRTRALKNGAMRNSAQDC